jgi:hypothetical protein
MMSLKSAYSLVALLIGFGLSGCTPIEHGRMGPWAQKPIWGTCKCSGGTAAEGAANSYKNTSFDGGSSCGGETVDARNQWCAEKCQAAGYAEGQYLMCLK